MKKQKEQLLLTTIVRHLSIFAKRARCNAAQLDCFKVQFVRKITPLFETEQGQQLPIASCFSDLINGRSSIDFPEKALVEKASAWSLGSNHADKETGTPALTSIFNEITTTKGEGTANMVFMPTALDLTREAMFPLVGEKRNDAFQTHYTELWESFAGEFDKLPNTTLRAFIESLLYLLKKYTWSMPVNSDEGHNTSLYEFIKNAVAFADCLHTFAQTGDVEEKLPMMLVGGDLSGIQKFIYNIASNKAAVSLKGRSFYLQLLIDAIIDRITNHSHIQVTMANVVYSSGGKFYMLLPHTRQVKDTIATLRDEFEKQLWEKHKGQLVMNMDAVPFAFSEDLRGIILEEGIGNIGSLWKALSDKLSAYKHMKFKNLLLESYNNLFKPAEVSSTHEVCAVTGIEGRCVPIDKKSDEVYVLPSVAEQAELGKILKGRNVVVMQEELETKPTLKILRTSLLLTTAEELQEQGDVLSIRTHAHIKQMNKLDFLACALPQNDITYGFQFYGGNVQALNSDGGRKTFEDLAKNSYLGVLKMDVDNLGAIFIKGLPSESKNFASYSTLSFLLDMFFSGYLNDIRERYKDDVNILYSGGDDVFAVGRWNKLLLFARDVRKEFKEFVGREDISISCGLTIVHDKYPIAKAAELSGEAEESAKRYKGGDGKPMKNAINLFGETLSWHEEFDAVQGWHARLMACYTMPGVALSRSLLHKLFYFASVIKRNKHGLKASEMPDLSYCWNTVYFITRFIERYDKNNEVKALCKDILAACVQSTRNYELLAVAARWTELELRHI